MANAAERRHDDHIHRWRNQPGDHGDKCRHGGRLGPGLPPANIETSPGRRELRRPGVWRTVGSRRGSGGAEPALGSRDRSRTDGSSGPVPGAASSLGTVGAVSAPARTDMRRRPLLRGIAAPRFRLPHLRVAVGKTLRDLTVADLRVGSVDARLRRVKAAPAGRCRRYQRLSWPSQQRAQVLEDAFSRQPRGSGRRRLDWARLPLPQYVVRERQPLGTAGSAQRMQGSSARAASARR